MATPSASRARRRGGLSVPCLLLLLCAWSPADARGQAVELTVKVKVADANGAVVPNAQILIVRQGTYKSGGRDVPLPRVAGETRQDGVYTSGETKTFWLDGKEDVLTVTAPPAYPEPVERIITDKMLSDALIRGKTLNIEVGPPTHEKDKQETQTLFINIADEDGLPVPNAKVTVFHKQKIINGQAEIEFVDGVGETGPDGKRPVSIEQFSFTAPQYTVRVEAKGFTPPPITSSFPDSEEKRAELSKQKTPTVNVNLPLGFFERLRRRLYSGLNNLLWYLGLAFLALLLVAALGYVFGHRLRRYRVGHDRPTTPEMFAAVFGRLDDLTTEVRRINVKAPVKTEEPSGKAKTPDVKEGGPASASFLIREGFEPNEVTPPQGSRDRETRELNRPDKVDGGSADTPYAGAQCSYVGLMNRQPMTPEPIYLDVEGARSIAGKLEDASVYLSPVPHSQGAFVLFTENGESGWVYPNPTIGYRQAALREVFPSLTEAEFAASKESIRPKPVKKVADRRWKVEAAATP